MLLWSLLNRLFGSFERAGLMRRQSMLFKLAWTHLRFVIQWVVVGARAPPTVLERQEVGRKSNLTVTLRHIWVNFGQVKTIDIVV
jgi:hypothetical protein